MKKKCKKKKKLILQNDFAKLSLSLLYDPHVIDKMVSVIGSLIIAPQMFPRLK